MGRAAALLAALALLAAPAGAQEPRGAMVAVVSIERVLEEAQVAQDLRAQSNAVRARLRRELGARDTALKEEEERLVALRASLQADRTDLEARGEHLSPEDYQSEADALQARMSAFQDRARIFEDAVRELRREGQAEGERLKAALDAAMASLREAVDPALGAAMRSRGATLLLDESTVLIHDRSLDLTDDVIARLDASDVRIELAFPPPR